MINHDYSQIFNVFHPNPDSVGGGGANFSRQFEMTINMTLQIKGV